MPENSPATATPEARPGSEKADEIDKIEKFGRYYLLERIGKGGMAEVYRAVTQGMEGFRRTFVVKRILADKARSPEFVRMFCEEARISALLHHPNIVQVYDFGQVDGSYFLAMEYLLGKDLSSVLRVLRASGLSLPLSLAAYIAQQAALGLDYAHSLRGADGQPLGIVHRDVTPANIMLLRVGGVKVLDFGIAKATAAGNQSPSTSGGFLKGKLGYLSPEQVRSEEIDGRADIFSLGVTLWEMLIGRRLFAGANEFETLRNVLQRPVPSPSTVRAGMPAAIDHVVQRALARDRSRRYQTADEMADDLEQIVRHARYDSHALRRLLEDLCGDEPSALTLDLPELALPGQPSPPIEIDVPEIGAEAQTQKTPAPRAGAASEVAVAVAPSVPPPARSRSHAPPFGVVTTSPRVLLAGAPVRPRNWRAMAWAGAPAALFVVLLVMSVSGVAARFELARTRARPTAPTPSRSQAPAVPSDSSADRGTAAAPPGVTLEIDSSPRGAEVRRQSGERLGATPLSFVVPRSDRAEAFVVAKAGYRAALYRVTPAHDAGALFDLERLGLPAAPAPRPKRKAAPRSSALGAAMTVNPF